MSVLYVIVCDDCHHEMSAGNTPYAARAALLGTGSSTNSPHGRDICPTCVADRATRTEVLAEAALWAPPDELLSA